MKTQSALEDMEFEVASSAGFRIKRPAPRAGHENIGPGAFVPKIDIQISKVQDNVVCQAKVDAAAPCPSAPDVPVAAGKLVRERAPELRVLVDSGYLANFGQADRTAAGSKYHYPVTQGVSDTQAPGAVPIQLGR